MFGPITPSSTPPSKFKGQFGPSNKGKDRTGNIYPPLPGHPTLDPFPQVYVPSTGETLHSTGYSESYTQTREMQEWRTMRELNRTNRRLMKEKQAEAR